MTQLVHGDIDVIASHAKKFLAVYDACSSNVFGFSVNTDEDVKDLNYHIDRLHTAITELKKSHEPAQSPLTRILDLTGLTEKDVIAVYRYGSRVYGTASEQSDHDYIVIHKGSSSNDAQQYDSHTKDLSVHTYHEESWQRHLDAHKIFAMECYSIDPTYRSSVKSPFTFTLNHAELRKEISSKASNSWVKCKKKLTVEQGEEYIGVKSLFHSFRIPMFGIQIAQYGRVVDFTTANSLWFDELEPILYTKPVWEELKEKYQPRHNALMSEFRKYAEKV